VTGDNGAEASPAYIFIRCPRCRNIRTEAAEGSQIRHKCRPCKIYFAGEVKDLVFKLKTVERAGGPPAVISVAPPSLTG
jgi:phage FluMu protein Com